MKVGRGQIMVLFAIAIFAIIALLGLVVDGANLYLQRRTGQIAADAAALAGARALRNATDASQVSTISAAIAAYAAANAFGIQPVVFCAYFIGTDGAALAGGGIVNDGSSGTCPTVTATIPTAASGVHVDTRVDFPTYIVGILNILSATTIGGASAQVGVLTASDTRSAPLIACGGGSGGYAALKLTTQTPVVVTSTPGVLAATPAVLPVLQNPAVTTDDMLVTPVGVATPAYVVNPARDGTIYYIKGQQISTSNGSTCGASGFHGASSSVQPTPYIADVTSGQAVIAGRTGNAVPLINQTVATSGACVAGTDPANNWTEGQPGCVMILPVVDRSTGLYFTIQAWAAFYVWCTRTTGAGCQEFSGQLLTNWPAAGGPAANTWTFGNKGGITVLHLTQ